MTLTQKREELVAQYEQLAGPGSATELLSKAAQARIVELNSRAEEMGNTKVFQKWIARLEQSGLSDVEAADTLRDGLLQEQARQLAKRPAAAAPPRSVGIPAVATATTTATPPPAATIPSASTPHLSEYENLRAKDPRLAGEYFTANGNQIVSEEAQRTRANRAEFRKQQAEQIKTKY